ncbi:glucosaminidase domain-containing protein [Candidatus Sulfurimonas baltica]|uniref:Glucosaminidase domain-containing protein n=1 Tax=Candidatus Sulfurimonas baltica TaxID=2740404 RepID=A0A7S7LY15_9BACT|nr:glucosaminidase domain-containing protein [Candidatus Sulfurimonas baltica]
MSYFTPLFLATLFFSTALFSSQYPYRKYEHVKKFYSEICLDAIEIGIKHQIPPAAIMAIAGLESGYGRGYVSQITGNILSLGAFSGDKELPSLYLPYSKLSKTIVYDKKIIKNHSENDLLWKKRAKSLKRDYRPYPYAGTAKKLELLKYDKKLKQKAYRECLNDFASRWIVRKSKVKVFRDARVWLNKKVLNNGISILFDPAVNEKFIDIIGGHPHSFNYRKAWPKKAKYIMKKTGLVELTTDIFNEKNDFNKVWSNK